MGQRLGGLGVLPRLSDHEKATLAQSDGSLHAGRREVLGPKRMLKPRRDFSYIIKLSDYRPRRRELAIHMDRPDAGRRELTDTEGDERRIRDRGPPLREQRRVEALVE